MHTTPSMPLVAAGALVADRYLLRRPLGVGRQGAVWEAEDTRDGDRPCAVKLTSGGGAEAGTLLRLDHPSLPRALDHGRWEAMDFLVMERVVGRPLSPAMPAAVIAEAAARVASALGALHDAGIVHGDVKPANVLVGDDGAWLVDLGLSGAAGDGALSGTPAFLAPEVLVGERGPASDLYALGVTLAMCLGGRHPLVDDPTDRAAVFSALARRDTPRPAALDSLPQALRPCVAWLLSWAPERRPPSARAWLGRWLRDAAGLLGNDPALAGLPSAEPGSLCGVPRVPLVARDAARDAATRGIEQALAGALVGVVLVGPPGAGRRRLADEALRAVRVASAARGEAPEVRDELPTEPSRPTIVRLIDAPADRVAAVAGAIARLRRFGGPIAPVALVATTTDPVADEGLMRLDVGPLDRTRVAELLAALQGDPPGSLAAPPVVEAWLDVTAGLAGRIVSVARTLGPAPVAGVSRDALRRAASAQAAPLPADLSLAARDAAVCLATAAIPLGRADLAAIVGTDSQAAVTELVRRGVAVSTGDAVALAAPLPFDGVDPEDRVRVGAAMERHLASATPARHGLRARAAVLRGDTTAAWQHGMRAAGDPGTPRAEAIAWLDRVAPWAPDPAAHALRLAQALVLAGDAARALAVLAPLTPSPTVQALEADALRRSGDRARARTLAEALVEGDDPAARAVGRMVLARDALDRGDAAMAAVALGASLAEGEGVPAALRPRALEIGGLVALAADDLDRAADRLERCDLAALAAGDNVERARAASLRGMIAQRRGDHEAARRLYRDAWSLAAQEGDDHGAATYLVNIGGAALECGDLGEAARALERAVRALAALGRLGELARALVNLASLLAWLGDRPGAADAARRAADAARLAGDAVTEGFAQAVEAEATLTGRAAAEALVSAAARLDAGGDAGRAVEVRARAATCLSAAGDPTGAAALLPAEGGGAMVALAGLEVALARRASPTELTAAVAAARAAVDADPSVEHTVWLLGAAERTAVATGDAGEAGRLRAAARSRIPALAATLPEALAALFLEAHPTTPEPAPAPGPGSTGDPASKGDPAAAQWQRLVAVTQKLNAESRLRPLLELVMDAVVELTGASRGFLLLRDPGGELRVRTARNLGQRDLEGDEMAPSRSVAERVARTGDAVVTVDATADGRFDAAESVHAMHLRSILAVPLAVRGEVVGTIYVDDRYRAGAFGDEAMVVARAFADAAALAIHNARTQSALRRALHRAEALSRELSRRIDLQQVELEATRQSVSPDATRGRYEGIIGRGGAMAKILALVDRVAPTGMSVLLQGESGTGKELVARAIHANSPRAGRPFVAENCGAIPETLLESVLFGHVKGAFTGADRTRPGLFEVADGGTLLLDEVGEMSAGMQAKLLRVLQDGEVRPVGSERSRKVDVRVIAATHRDLAEMVRRGTFREDLFYRLAVMVLPVPSLRDRREDIPALVAHFITRHGAPGTAIDRRAMARLVAAPWPGNVRQLANEIQRAAVLSDGTIREEDLTPGLGVAPPPGARDAGATRDGDAARAPLDLRGAVEDVEREMVERALVESGGNQSSAARALGLSRFGLQKKLKRLGISAREASRRLRVVK